MDKQIQEYMNVINNADAMTEQLEAVFGQTVYAEINHIGLGARDFYQVFVCKLPEPLFGELPHQGHFENADPIYYGELEIEDSESAKLLEAFQIVHMKVAQALDL